MQSPFSPGEPVEIRRVCFDPESGQKQEEWVPATVQHSDSVQTVAVTADGVRHAMRPGDVRSSSDVEDS